MSNIAFLTSWNAVCGVSEFARFLATEFKKNGHELVLFNNYFAGDYQEIPTSCQKDLGPQIQIFETGFQPNLNQQSYFNIEVFEKEVVSRDIQILLVNYQDYIFPNKYQLNDALRFCKKAGIKTFILFHDSCISPELDLSLTDYLVFPPSVYQFKSHSKAICIDQGIPEFREFETALNDLLWILGCFGLGRNKIDELCKIVEEINSEDLLDRPLGIMQHIPKRSDYGQNKATIMARGYRPAEELADNLNSCHACIIWYPDITQQSTSSAFRFAVGSRVPIICNRSNWVSDQIGNGAWIEVAGDDPQLFKEAILKTFKSQESYGLLRERLSIMQQKLIDKSGWSKIAKQYEHYF